jgi:ABC-type transporter Mla subunit MlaD
LALVVTIIGVYLGFTKSIPFRSHYEVKAAFKSANNIRRGSPVRIAGVEVGKVTKIERGHEGDEGAILTMRVQDKGRPLHPDAHFKIRPRIFLEGNFFVDVTPGTSSREVADNHTFPVQQTDTPVQLDEVLTALQTDTREDLKTVLREYSSGLKGKGAKGFNG